MDQAATVVQAAGRGVFGNGKTLSIEEREFDYQTERGQDYKFFLVVRPHVYELLRVIGLVRLYLLVIGSCPVHCTGRYRTARA